MYCILFFFFFFSSRRRHTRYWRDWSSDVCSSDLDRLWVAALDGIDRQPIVGLPAGQREHRRQVAPCRVAGDVDPLAVTAEGKSVLVEPGDGRPALAHDLLEGYFGAQSVIGYDGSNPCGDRTLSNEAKVLAAKGVPVPTVEKDQNWSLRLLGGEDVQALGQGRPIWDVEVALEPLAGLSALLLIELLVVRELGHSLSQIVLGVQLLLG